MLHNSNLLRPTHNEDLVSLSQMVSSVRVGSKVLKGLRMKFDKK